MDDKEFEHRGHWIHIVMTEVGDDRWRAAYSIDTQSHQDVGDRPIPYAAVLREAQQMARDHVDRLIERDAADGNTVVVVGTACYRFPTAEEAAEGRAWMTWVVGDEEAFANRFPNAHRVAFIGGSRGLAE